MKSIELIIPAYNEQDALPNLARALRPLLDNELTSEPYSWSVLMIDDGSTDLTASVMEELHASDPRYKPLFLSRNFGKESAMLAGLDHADADAVIIMDADLQHPVDVIPRLIDKWREGFDDVYGRRVGYDRHSPLRNSFTRLFYKLLGRVDGFGSGPEQGDFRLLSRRCVQALRSLRETQRYTKGLFNWIGFSKSAVDYSPADRTEGSSSFNFRRLFELAVNGMTSFSTLPLRLASILGFIASFAALVYMIIVFIKTLIHGDPVAGFPTIICVVLFLGGAQLICLGIIGEYIGKIFLESKRRPPYILKSPAP